ncbi:hypothetical protein FQZ97_869910 [compost metagenome]
MRGGGEQAFADQLVFVVGFQRFQQAGELIGAEPGIHLRDLGFKLIAVAVGETARYKYLFHLPGLFGIYVTENGVNTFLLGIINKPAGVDHHDLRIIFGRLMADVHAVSPELGVQHLRIYQVFGAPQGYDIDFCLSVAFCFHSLPV